MRLVDLASKEEKFVTLVPLAEALKVRVISKGPPFTYTALKPLQLFMWRVLKDIPCFKLIGQPVSIQLLAEQLGRKLGVGNEYLSVDYADATNEMLSEVSTIIADELVRVLEIYPQLAELFHQSLTEHYMVVDVAWAQMSEQELRDEIHEILLKNRKLNSERFRDAQVIRQQNGQLMGSIVSFIILCLANAAICRWTTELSTGKIVPLDKLKGLINGDDAVIEVPEVTGKKIWEKIAKYHGLSPSVGKVYASREYLNVNSTSFLVRFRQFRHHPDDPPVIGSPIGERVWEPVYRRCQHNKIDCRECPKDLRRTEDRHYRETPFTHVKYVNMGLLNGMGRSSASDIVSFNSRDQTLGACARELLEQSPAEMHTLLLDNFIDNNLEKLKGVRLPWFMPEWIGGVGLPPQYHPCDPGDIPDVIRGPSGRALGPTDLDYQVAIGIRNNWSKVRPHRVPSNIVWMTHQYAEKQIGEASLLVGGLTDLANLGTAEYELARKNFERLYTLLCVQAMFNMDLDQIHLSKPIDRVKFTIRHNERLWRPERYNCRFVTIENAKALWFRHFEEPRDPILLVQFKGEGSLAASRGRVPEDTGENLRRQLLADIQFAPLTRNRANMFGLRELFGAN